MSAKAVSHPFLSAVEKDELLQDMVLQLNQEYKSKWAFVLPPADSWTHTDVTLDVFHATTIIIKPQGVVSTIDGQVGSLSVKDGKKVLVLRGNGSAPPTSRVVAEETTSTVTLGNQQIAVHVYHLADTSGSKEASQDTSSTKVYTTFITKMRQPQAAPLVRSIKKFISEIESEAESAGGPGDTKFQMSLPKKVGTFTEVVFQDLLKNTLWEGSSKAELAAAREGMQKYILCKLYNYAFGQCAGSKEVDEQLSSKLTDMQHVTFAMISNGSTFKIDECVRWHEAMKQLCAINDFKSPLDKITCISNCCRVILHILQESTGSLHTAELRPYLIYLVLKAHPASLFSNLTYIFQYRQEIVGEDEYYLTTLQSVCKYWLAVDPNNFKPPSTPATVHEADEELLSNTERRLSLTDLLDGSGGMQSTPTPADEERVAVGLRKALDEYRKGPPPLPYASLQQVPLGRLDDVLAEMRRLWALEEALRPHVSLPAVGESVLLQLSPPTR